MFLSHTGDSLSLSHLPLPLSKINKHILGRGFKKCFEDRVLGKNTFFNLFITVLWKINNSPLTVMCGYDIRVNPRWQWTAPFPLRASHSSQMRGLFQVLFSCVVLPCPHGWLVQRWTLRGAKGGTTIFSSQGSGRFDIGVFEAASTARRKSLPVFLLTEVPRDALVHPLQAWCPFLPAFSERCQASPTGASTPWFVCLNSVFGHL